MHMHNKPQQISENEKANNHTPPPPTTTTTMMATVTAPSNAASTMLIAQPFFNNGGDGTTTTRNNTSMFFSSSSSSSSSAAVPSLPPTTTTGTTAAVAATTTTGRWASPLSHNNIKSSTLSSSSSISPFFDRLKFVEVALDDDDEDQSSTTTTTTTTTTTDVLWPCLWFPNFASLTETLFGTSTAFQQQQKDNYGNNNNNSSFCSSDSILLLPPNPHKRTSIQAQLTLEHFQHLFKGGGSTTTTTPVVYLLGRSPPPPHGGSGSGGQQQTLSLYLPNTDNDGNNTTTKLKDFMTHIPEFSSAAWTYPHSMGQAQQLVIKILQESLTSTFHESTTALMGTTTAITATRCSNSSSITPPTTTTGGGVSWYQPVASTQPPPRAGTAAVTRLVGSPPTCCAATVVSLPDDEHNSTATTTSTTTTKSHRMDDPPLTPKHSNLKNKKNKTSQQQLQQSITSHGPPSKDHQDYDNEEKEDEEDTILYQHNDDNNNDDVNNDNDDEPRNDKTTSTTTTTATTSSTMLSPSEKKKQQRGRPKQSSSKRGVVPKKSTRSSSDNKIIVPQQQLRKTRSSISTTKSSSSSKTVRGKTVHKGPKTKSKKSKLTVLKSKKAVVKDVNSTSPVPPSTTTISTTTTPKKQRSPRTPPSDVEVTGFDLDIPTFEDVKPLLKKLGYTFIKGQYSVPGEHGPDFLKEDDFRQYLCRHHVQWADHCFHLTGEKEQIETELQGYKDTIHRYVRYAILTPLNDNNVESSSATATDPIPELQIHTNKFIKWMQKLGLKYLTLDLYDGYYALPGVKRSEYEKDVTVFQEKPGLWKYLAKNGLPSNCHFTALTSLQRLALEQCIANYGIKNLEAETFTDMSDRNDPLNSNQTNRVDASSDSRSPTPSRQRPQRASTASKSTSSSITGTEPLPQKVSHGTTNDVQVKPKRRSSTSSVDRSAQQPKRGRPKTTSSTTTTTTTDTTTTTPLMGDRDAWKQSSNPPRGHTGNLPPPKDLFRQPSLVDDLEVVEAIPNVEPVPLAEMSTETATHHEDDRLIQEEFFSRDVNNDDDAVLSHNDEEPPKLDDEEVPISSTGVTEQTPKDRGCTGPREEAAQTKATEEGSTGGKRKSRQVEGNMPSSKRARSKSISAENEPRNTSTLVECAASVLLTKGKQSTVADALQCCLKVLQTSYVHSTIVGWDDSSSHKGMQVSYRLDQITSFLEGFIQSQGGSGGDSGSAAALHVCGFPGTGKTMGVKFCCKEVLKYAKKLAKTIVDRDDQKEFQVPVVCHMNVAHVQAQSKKDVIDIILKEIGKAVHKGKGSAITDKKLQMKSKAVPPVIVVLDEIDMMVSGRQTTNLSTAEGALQTILAWAADPTMAFGVIGISNSVENSKGRRLANLGSFHDKVVFQTYSKDELVTIVESRVGRAIVDPKLIEFVASKVAATSGDARKVLELTSMAVQKCREKLTPEKLEAQCSSLDGASAQEKPIVLLPHAMMAIRDTLTKYADVIASQTPVAKTLLCVGTALARELDDDSVSMLTLGMLKKYTMEALHHEMYDYEMEDMKMVVENLVDSGLLKLAARDRKAFSTESFNSLANIPVRLELQLEDVSSALDKTLLQQDFYSKLVKRVKSQHKR